VAKRQRPDIYAQTGFHGDFIDTRCESTDESLNFTHRTIRQVLSAISGLAQSAYKMCGDIRLLASMKEIGKLSRKYQALSPSHGFAF